MNVMVIPVVKVVTKVATAAGLSRIVSGVVMTNTPIDTKTQLYLVRVATFGLTSLLAKHVGDHTDEQIDTIVDMVKNRGDGIKIVLEKTEEVKDAVVESLSDLPEDKNEPQTYHEFHSPDTQN